jgi:hypothetical protein
MARHLVGHRVHHGVTELEIRGRRDGVQVAHVELGRNGLAATLELEIHRAAYSVVRHLLERFELRDQLAIHAHQHVTGLQRAVGRTARQHLVHHEHAGERGKRLARGLFGFLVETEATQLVVRRVVEHHLQRAARHGLARLDEFERAFHAAER